MRTGCLGALFGAGYLNRRLRRIAMSEGVPNLDATAAVRAVRASIAEDIGGVDRAMASVGGRADVFATVLLVATTRLVENLAEAQDRPAEEILREWESDLRQRPPG